MKAKMGRPVYVATASSKRRVALCAARGMAEREIAALVGCNVATLRKHFEVELSIAACVKAALAEARPVAEAKAAALPKGKKERAQFEAINAQRGTGWDDLLPETANQ